MVKQQKKNIWKKRDSKGFIENRAKARKINVSTEFDTCQSVMCYFGYDLCGPL